MLGGWLGEDASLFLEGALEGLFCEGDGRVRWYMVYIRLREELVPAWLLLFELWQDKVHMRTVLLKQSCCRVWRCSEA